MSEQERIDREKALRRAVLRGEESAWRCWYEIAEGPLRAYVLWRCGGLREAAEELIQETWLVAVRRIRNFDPAKGAFLPWLRGIAAGLMRNYFRREKLRRASLSNGHAEPEDARTDQARRVAENLAELPERYEAVLRAKYLEERAVKEIAEQWGESDKAIESLLTRARNAFRQSYQDEAHDDAR